MAFRFDKLTVKAQEAVQRAQSLAQDFGNPQLLPLHLLAALLKEEQGLVRATWDTPEAGPAKRSYQLTRQGRACMAKWLGTLKRYRQSIDELVSVLDALV
jgi:ATP-dependent Clp protease ATP-binding subunit ClpA